MTFTLLPRDAKPLRKVPFRSRSFDLRNATRDQIASDAATKTTSTHPGAGAGICITTTKHSTPPPTAIALATHPLRLHGPPETDTHPLSHPLSSLPSAIRLTRLPRNSKPTLTRSSWQAPRCKAHKWRVRRARMHHLPPARLKMVSRRQLRDGPRPYYLRYAGGLCSVLLGSGTSPRPTVHWSRLREGRQAPASAQRA